MGKQHIELIFKYATKGFFTLYAKLIMSVIILLFIISLSSVGVRSDEKADNSENKDNVSISLSLSRLCQGKTDTSGQGSYTQKEEKEKITGLSDQITDLQAQQSKVEKTIAKLEKNVLKILKHIETMQSKGTMESNQPRDISPTIIPTTQATEPPNTSMAKHGLEGGHCLVGPCLGTPGASSYLAFGTQPIHAFESKRRYWQGESCQFPAYIWWRFPMPHRLAKISVCVMSVGPRNSPKKLDVVASDDCENWTDLLNIEDTGFTESSKEKAWVIPSQNRAPFHCIGLRWPIHGLYQPNANGCQNAQVSHVSMWEEL